jgi:hypothetical protein
LIFIPIILTIADCQKPTKISDPVACQSQGGPFSTPYSKDGKMYQRYKECTCVDDNKCKCESVEKEVPCSGIISGHVYDAETGSLLSGAALSVSGKNCAALSANGYFELRCGFCPNTEYNLSCFLEGYYLESGKSITTDNSGDAKYIDFYLKLSTKVKKGYGAWLYGKDKSFINLILNYNKLAAENKKINYIFCRVGGINLKNRAVSKYDGLITAYYKNNLPGCKIYPMLDASDKDGIFKAMTSEQLDTLAQSIAKIVDADLNADGIHLDIEPYNDKLISLIEKLSLRSKKPVTVAIGIPNPKEELFNHASFVVLMNYDLNPDLAKFERLSREHINTFLGLAKKAKGYGMIGIPAVATHREYEYRSNRMTG